MTTIEIEKRFDSFDITLDTYYHLITNQLPTLLTIFDQASKQDVIERDGYFFEGPFLITWRNK